MLPKAQKTLRDVGLSEKSQKATCSMTPFIHCSGKDPTTVTEQRPVSTEAGEAGQ